MLLKRPENLTEKQAVKLNELLQYNLKSDPQPSDEGGLSAILELHLSAWAGKFLDEWCTRAMRSKIEPMKKMARTIREKRELILNWFRADGTDLGRDCRGLQQQTKTDHQKIVRLPHPKSLRNRPLSQPRQPTRARIHPQILLRRHF